MIRLPTNRLVFTCCALMASVASNAMASVAFYGFGRYPGAASSECFGVSADGSTAVGLSGASANYSGFRWTVEGGLQSIGTLPGGISSSARATNADGSIVAGWSNATAADERVIRWTSTSGMTSLGVLAGYNRSVGTGINADGSVIVGYGDNNPGHHAFRWTAQTGIQSIQTLAGVAGSEATGVSANGNVVVGTITIGEAVQTTHSFRWTPSEGMVDIGTLGGLGGRVFAAAVSHDGSTIVGNATIGNGTLLRGFRWTAEGGMQQLATPLNATTITVNAVNGDGSVAVGRIQGGTPTQAYMWMDGSAPIELHSYLQSLGVNLAGWQLRNATGISADGLTIVGNGTFNGVNQGWMAVIPAPSGALGLLACSAIMARRRR